MSERLLNIKNLSVTFGGYALRSRLPSTREIVSVISPNGAGKTTFFNSLGDGHTDLRRHRVQG